jgi:hypothetical protein
VAPGKSSCQPWDVPLAAHARICFVVSRFIGENRGVNFIRPQLEAIIPLAKASKVTDAFPGPQTPDQSLRPTADPKSTYTLALFISGDNSARTLTEITLRSLTAKLKWTAGGPFMRGNRDNETLSLEAEAVRCQHWDKKNHFRQSGKARSFRASSAGTNASGRPRFLKRQVITPCAPDQSR